MAATESAESDLALLQRCVGDGRLLLTYHVDMRLRERRVARHLVMGSVDTYQIIEHYPASQASRCLPSCRIRAEDTEGVIHVLLALDREGNNVRVFTVYRPDPRQWETGFTRRKRP